MSAAAPLVAADDELWQLARIDVPFTVINLATTAAALVLPFFYHSRSAVVAFAVLYTVVGLGLTAGYHRLFAHKSYSVPKWLERTIALIAYLAIQRGPIFWVAMHRLHHKYSDLPGRDPHSPT
ncbi:MAG TPA: fatty acid desaturase, partial [Thermoanaerobaculia bacterium]|nr:fatty acid desaturase [Thermoanaerobaculia bacterium]